MLAFIVTALKPGEKEERKGRPFYQHISLPIELAAAVLIGAFGGYGLDRWLGTTPWLFLVGSVIGSAAGIFNIFRSVTLEDIEKKRGGINGRGES